MERGKMTMANEPGGGGWSQFLRQLTISQVFIGILGLALFVALAVGIYYGGGALLQSLQVTEVAGGLITFLVAFATVAIAIILALYALVSSSTQDLKDRFELGKEILTALIGVLGTIVGFYFGSSTQQAIKETIKAEGMTQQALQVAAAFVSNGSPRKGDTVVLSSFVSGGKPPYSYSIAFTPSNIISAVRDRISSDGVIKEEIKIPESIQQNTEFTFSNYH
jgi:hypothetical protein